MPDENPHAPTPATPTPAPAPAPTPSPSPSPSPSPTKKPDAVLIPLAWSAGLSLHDNADLVCTYAENVLGGDRANGVRAYARTILPDQTFVTLNYNDTLFNEYGHPRQKQPRYRWETQPDGSKWGWLNDDATPTKPMDGEADAAPTNPLARLMAEKRRKETARAPR